MKRFAPASLAVLLGVATSVGCVSSEGARRVALFAETTAVTVENVTSAFETVDRSYAELAVLKAAASYDEHAFDPEQLATARFLAEEDLRARLKVLAGLRSYAERLALLAGGSRGEVLDRETRNLAEELAGLNATFVEEHFLKEAPVAGQQIELFATAVNALGRWFLDLKRLPVLREQIAAMTEPVNRICELLVLDLGRPADDGDGPAGGLRLQLWNQHSEALRVQDLFLRHHLAELDLLARRAEVRALLDLVEERRRADEALAATQRSLRRLSQAQAKLAEPYEKGAVAIDELLWVLHDEGKRIKRFYESLR